MANVYIIKVSSARNLNDIISHVEQVGRVIAFNLVANGKPRVRKTPVFTPEAKTRSSEAKRQVQLARSAAHKELVHKDLGRILLNNQHAPLETIVKLLNSTEARTMRGSTFTNDTVQFYITFSLERLTSVTTSNGRPVSTPPASLMSVKRP